MINIETLFYRAGDHVICRMLQHAAFGNRCTVNLNKALTALGKQPIALDSIPEKQICFLREKYSELDLCQLFIILQWAGSMSFTLDFVTATLYEPGCIELRQSDFLESTADNPSV